MLISEVVIDLLRAAHLVCFAAGMGTGLYFDFRMIRTLGNPIDLNEIRILESVHEWVNFAFMGLWATGIILIYVRTGFDLAAFSPKLWLKLGIMTLLALNSVLIGRVVFQTLNGHTGYSLAELPPVPLVIISQISVISMFCWTSGLLLGSGVALKTASWEVLVPLAIGWFVVLSVFGQFVVIMTQRRIRFRI